MSLPLDAADVALDVAVAAGELENALQRLAARAAGTPSRVLFEVFAAQVAAVALGARAAMEHLDPNHR